MTRRSTRSRPPSADQGSYCPPTFVQSSAQFDPDYVLRPKIGAPWFGSGKNPTGAQPGSGGGGNGGGLHAEQHYEYHRHPQAGDVLTATVKPGKSWEKQGRRGGKLLFQETITEYRDQNGDLVVTARGIGVRTERPAWEDLMALKASELKVGCFSCTVEDLKRTQIVNTRVPRDQPAAHR